MLNDVTGQASGLGSKAKSGILKHRIGILGKGKCIMESPLTDSKALADVRGNQAKWIRWGLFIFFTAIVPIVIDMFLRAALEKPITPTDLFSHGQYYLVSVAIVLEALIDMAIKNDSDTWARIILGSDLAVLIFGSIGYGVAASGAFPNVGFVVSVSVLVVISAVICGSVSIRLTER